ncbi:MAG: dTDP-4-dehydrorhamnose reductase [Spirochaetes bacterium]|nr:dTDP-4-dehydrorhamnose reductase [Spirochaetota bacterium]
MIWLVGNKGMLGTDVQDLIEEQRWDYVATDNEVDITRPEKIESFTDNKRIDQIINCAAFTNVDSAESEKEKAMQVNAEGVKNLSRLARKKKASFIHISTDYVFDGKKTDPYKEDDRTHPLNVYGRSKLKGEHYIQKILRDFYIIRTAWLYGKNGNNFVHTMLKLFRTGDEIKIVSDQKGSPTYTRDLADCIIQIIKNRGKKCGIYHFTNEGITSWFDFAKKIYVLALKYNIIQKKIDLIPVSTEEYPLPAVRPENSSLSKKKIRDIFSLTIRPWQEALEEFIKELGQ